MGHLPLDLRQFCISWLDPRNWAQTLVCPVSGPLFLPAADPTQLPAMGTTMGVSSSFP